MKHRFFSICRFASTLWWRTRKRQFWTSGDRGRKETFQYRQTIENIYIFLYLKAFLYLFILQKGTVKHNLPQLHSLLWAGLVKLLRCSNGLLCFFRSSCAFCSWPGVFQKCCAVLSWRGRPLSRHTVVWGCYNVNWFQNILKGSCLFVWFAFWYHLQFSF